MNRTDPPAADEFEISIIGPGRGESVVVHLGNNQWCIVDSCISAGKTEPVALDYLGNFRNGAVAGVKLVVATHWHDDHIRGLASILKQVPQASFFCSAALKDQNFLTLTSIAGSSIKGNSGVQEFADILHLIGEGAKDERSRRLASPKWAIENLPVLEFAARDRPFPVRITALSPSHGTMKLAFEEFAKMVPKKGEAQRSLIGRTHNHTSVVLWIEAGPLTVLLGADLEHTRLAGEGWMAVLDCDKFKEKPELASLFKVPHHGSANGDHQPVWTQLLCANPIAIVTPYNPTKLPKDSDLLRLSNQTNRLYCTSAGPGKSVSRDAVVERTMKERLLNRRRVEGQAGHVRVRWSGAKMEKGPTVETFNGAYKID